MYFEFSEEQKAIRDTAKKFAEERIAPVQDADERQGIFRREIVEEMGRLGFWGAIIPEEYGGSNIGFLGSVIIMEEIARVSASYADEKGSSDARFSHADCSCLRIAR